jgi:TrmH family RNA methyltransferase
MEVVRSRQNAGLKHLLRLAEDGRTRRQLGLTLLDGDHLLRACRAGGGQLQQLVVAESASSLDLAPYLDSDNRVPVLYLADALFRLLSPVATPTGMLGVMAIPAASAWCHTAAAVLLDDVQDPGNLGGLLRTAVAAGIGQIALSPGCADVWSPKVLRAAMGAHFGLQCMERANLAELARKQCGPVLVTTLDGAVEWHAPDLRGPVTFIFGNEGQGVSPDVAAAATQRIRIGMPGPMESLNVAAAAAICLFERVRQLKQAHLTP